MGDHGRICRNRLPARALAEVGLLRCPARGSAGLPALDVGYCYLATAGVGLTLLGVVAVSAFEKESVRELQPGETMQIAGYELLFEGMTPRTGPNFTENLARIIVTTPSGRTYQLSPSKRLYPARQMPTTEAAIRTKGFSQLYLSVGDTNASGATVIRAWWKPWITPIWIGTVFMVLGGVISLSDRRLRVGVAKSSRSPKEREAKGAAT